MAEVHYTPDNHINRMMAQVKRSNLFSRPYLYYVTITPPNKMHGGYAKLIREIALNCETVSIPGQTIATKEHKTYGLKREYAYEKLLEPIDMSFYLSDNLQEFYFLKQWIDLTWPDNGRMGYYSDYIGTIEIHQCSGVVKPDENDLSVMLSVKLIEAYPKTLSGLELGHGTQGSIQKVSTNIVYRDIKYTDHTGLVSEHNDPVIKSWSDWQRKVNNAAGADMSSNTFTEMTSPMKHFLDDLSLPKLSTMIRIPNLGGIGINS